ncbi:MAG: tandem-95 repeat protein [Ardenticatenaceae bacterium]|nr:tandem-95 repeat protein [Ardenticatenaceae bacterium]
MKRLLIICILGLSLFALAGLHPARVGAAPLRQTGCTLPATVTTADQLYDCITAANAGSGGTITLDADINLTDLTTSPLPQITSEITLEGDGHTIDGGWNGTPGSGMQIFSVAGTGDFTVNQATLQHGEATNGGAIYNDGGTLTVTNSTISDNSASDNGGAIYTAGYYATLLTVSNSTFSGNSASNYGGAIYNARYATLTVSNSTFSGNSASDAGGAIYNAETYATLTVSNSTFSGNSASKYGGAIYNVPDSTLTVSNSTFSGNSVNYAGGAIENRGTLTVSNSTFSGNNANDGGAIESFYGTATITNSTFSGNNADFFGGAIYSFGRVTYLAGNIFVAGARGDNCNGSLRDNGYNLSDDTSCINGGPGSVTNATLNLGPLADNGGPTQTRLPGAGSDAIGAIPAWHAINNNGTALACNGSTTDQTGNSRPLTAGTACTSGAVEVAPIFTSLTIIKDANPAIGTDFDFTINSEPLTSYSGSTSGNPFWTRPNEGGTCTLSTNSVRYHVQAFMVDTSGVYNLLSVQGYNGYIHLYQDGFNPLDQCTNYVNGNDDGLTNNTSLLDQILEAGRVYYLVTSGFAAANAGSFTNSITGVGTVYTLASSFTLDDAVPDDGDDISASTTFVVDPRTFSITELLPNNAWNLTGATCTGASGSVSLTDETLSVEVGTGETVACTFTNESLCPADWTVSTANELSACITLANTNESPSPTADTITLGADIALTTLTTSPLPQITSEITVEGAGYAIDGGSSMRIFSVATTGDFTVNQATLRNGASAGDGNNGGGAIFNAGSTAVTAVTFSTNTAPGLDGGGAVWNDHYGATFSATDSTFSGNSAGFAGAVLNGFSSTMMLKNSTFTGNSAGQAGAVVNWDGATMTLTNSTFSGNSATEYGGALANFGSPFTTILSATNNTFVDNTADDSTIYNSGTLHLAGNLLAAGTSGDNCFGEAGSTLSDNGYNLSDDASCGFSGTSADNATLNLGALADNGGPTLTHLPGAGSDAIGVIPNGTTISNNSTTWTCDDADPFTDQRGVSRPITLATACTAGAVEVALPPLCPSWTASTADELYDCLTLANANESPSPTADTITLGADINLTDLTTSPLPQIGSEITVEGAGYAIDGGGSVRLFNVQSGGNFTISQATLQNGSATNGGGIANNGGTLVVANSSIISNSATYGGGIGNYSAGTATVINSTLSGNSAIIGGGGIENKGTLTVVNSTFSGNLAPSGGGIDNYTVLTMTNSTFSGNSAIGLINSFGTVHLAGNIFAAGASGDNCVNDGTLYDNGYNLSDDTTCTDDGTGSVSNATLNLGPLADNGGPTQTHLPGAGSDAIGAIPNGTTISNNGTIWTCDQSTTDQRGVARPINSGDACTAGAVEVAPFQNAAPVAVDDSATTDEDTAVTIDVLANDSDSDGDSLTVESVTDPTNGTVVNNGTDVTYTPNANFNGVDSFSYTVSDGNGGSDTATVTITVNGVNDAPVANDDSATTDEDTAVTIDVLANDSDSDGDSLTVESVTHPTNGTAVNNATDVTYTPDAGFATARRLQLHRQRWQRRQRHGHGDDHGSTR